MTRRIAVPIALSLIMMVFDTSLGQTPQILSTSPVQNELAVAQGTDLSVTFDTDMDEATINVSTFVLNGSLSGPCLGTISSTGRA